jgi:hypothetical protein
VHFFPLGGGNDGRYGTLGSLCRTNSRRGPNCSVRSFLSPGLYLQSGTHQKR